VSFLALPVYSTGTEIIRRSGARSLCFRGLARHSLKREVQGPEEREEEARSGGGGLRAEGSCVPVEADLSCRITSKAPGGSQ
jgi:hypothetical protein